VQHLLAAPLARLSPVLPPTNLASMPPYSSCITLES
jgi:hypothetical protein